MDGNGGHDRGDEESTQHVLLVKLARGQHTLIQSGTAMHGYRYLEN